MINLKLDTNAVIKLFSDEESRVELQQAVINNVVQELVLKNSKNKVQETIQKEISLVGARLPDVTPMVKEQLNKFFVSKGWNKVEGTFELERIMKEEANRVAYSQVMGAVSDQVEKAVKDLEGRIENALKMSETRMEQLIVDRLNKKFTEVLDRAIAERVKTIFPGV
ncbi:hypothetical protein CPT_CIP9_191 [Enterobacter phage vB_EclM_CIP9]|uniref:Uncharacterized protein n=1 Tax=Enterobacter phage vB_EclM_CIP9 TaxID=2696340 RepID=A0A6B9XX42_9CAUD|nr:hypothetical protein HWD05_gp191 [Enterobacter phage vB_EclM_CIP9]QHS01727.1 hypothetical protein CPT_CIP9_191 [Enterobacter phage vB_EclM_CIP9]